MQKVDLVELRRLHDAATKGEWTVKIGHSGARLCLFLHRGPNSDGDYLNGCGNDVESIAAAHNALPALLDELEAAREVVREESNRWVEIIRGIDLEALCDFHDEHGSQEYLKSWLDARDRHMKLIGAAEELEKVAKLDWFVFPNVTVSATVDMILRRAAKLRQEAEDGK